MILEDCSVNFKFYNLNLYVTDMIPVLEVAPMVPSFSKELLKPKRIVDSSTEKYL